MHMLRSNLRHGAALSLLTCLALAALASCSGLPKDWPIKQLTLPPGSHVAEIPNRLRDMRTNVTQVPEVGKVIDPKPKWEVAFNTEGGWTAVISSVSGQLTPLGYTEWKPSEGWSGGGTLAGLTGSTKLEDVVHIYQSKEFSVVVLNVQNVATHAGEGANEEGSFVIDISPVAPAT